MSAPNPDDDLTKLKPAAKPVAASSDGASLPVGTRIGEFEVVSVVGIGGFGIVYLAFDHSLERRIALKEYMPSSLATRDSSTLHVRVKAEQHADTFDAGMRSFINEARLLAQFDHPALVKVYRFWEANGTAYMAMPFYEGLTLKQTLRGFDSAPDEAWLKALLAPLLDALETIHAENCFHRDIAPDNILMLGHDRPLLLDFGAARRAIGDIAQAFTVILKPGYAPVEQYANDASMQQGAWTDIYALASVVHFAITGRPPAPSIARMINDVQVPLVQSASGRYSEDFLQVIDGALAVMPANRPQTIDALRTQLGLERIGPMTQTRTMSSAPISVTTPAPSNSPARRDNGAAVAGATVSVSPLTDAPSVRPARSNLLVKGLVGAGVVMLAAAIFFFLKRDQGTTPPATMVTHQPAPLATTERDLAASTTTPSATVAAPATIAATPPPIVPTETMIDPVETLDQIYRARDRGHEVAISIDKSRVRIGKDPLRFSVLSSKSGYVYLLMVGTDRSEFSLLFPNSVDKKNRIEAGKTVDLPRRGWNMTAGGPAGFDKFVAIVSESPRDFSAVGMKATDVFGSFPLTAPQAVIASGAAIPLHAGQAICADHAAASCPQAYGAALFSIEEIAPR